MHFAVKFALNKYNVKPIKLFELKPGSHVTNNGSVEFLGICSVDQVIFLPILFRECFSHDNDTKIIKFGWKLLIS